MTGIVHVAIVDDHLLFRQGLATLLGTVSDIRVVTHGPDADTVLGSAESAAIDVLLLDVETGGPPVRQTIAKLRRGHSRIAPIVLTMHRDSVLRRALLDAGASDFRTKDEPLPVLVDAIRHAARDDLAHREPRPDQLLTDREQEVLRLVAAARSNAEIADDLHLAVGTVKRHVYNLFRKLDASSRLEALSRARLLGILDD